MIGTVWRHCILPFRSRTPATQGGVSVKASEPGENRDPVARLPPGTASADRPGAKRPILRSARGPPGDPGAVLLLHSQTPADSKRHSRCRMPFSARPRCWKVFCITEGKWFTRH